MIFENAIKMTEVCDEDAKDQSKWMSRTKVTASKQLGVKIKQIRSRIEIKFFLKIIRDKFQSSSYNFKKSVEVS